MVGIRTTRRLAGFLGLDIFDQKRSRPVLAADLELRKVCVIDHEAPIEVLHQAVDQIMALISGASVLGKRGAVWQIGPAYAAIDRRFAPDLGAIVFMKVRACAPADSAGAFRAND